MALPSRRFTLALGAVALTSAVAAGLGAGTASAHTESQYVAVPAGDEITVNFAPTHGCSGSPTTAVSVRVPAPGATAGDVEGFTATAEPDGDDRTVLRWTGGIVPADEEGEFPITFTVPDRVGELLLFPTVQTCEVGEVAWIDGDPEGEHPAVRMLVLPAGSEPAHELDEVPADAPGRDQLTAIVDVDNPDGATTTTPATSPPTTEATTSPTSAPATTTGATGPATTESAPTSSVSATTAPETPAPSDSSTAPTIAEEEDDDGTAGTVVFVVVVLVVLVGAGVGVLMLRRRRS